MKNTFYYVKEDRVLGPVEFEELNAISCAGIIKRSSMVYPCDIKQWVSADTELTVSYTETNSNGVSISSTVSEVLRFKWSKIAEGIEGLKAPLKNEFSVPERGITIQFREGRYRDFPEILALAVQTETHESCKLDKYVWHQATFQSLVNAFEMMKFLALLKYKRLYIDGILQDWDTHYYLWSCLSEREKSSDPLAYCGGKGDLWRSYGASIGCKQLNVGWWHYGKFDSCEREKGHYLYILDKNRITEELNKILSFREPCPFFDDKQVTLFVSSLPSEIMMPDEKWEFVRDHEEYLDSIRVDIPSVDDFGNSYIDSFWSSSISPKKNSDDILY